MGYSPGSASASLDDASLQQEKQAGATAEALLQEARDLAANGSSASSTGAEALLTKARELAGVNGSEDTELLLDQPSLEGPGGSLSLSDPFDSTCFESPNSA